MTTAPETRITPAMVSAAWSKGKDLRMSGLPTDFRQVLEAAMAAAPAAPAPEPMGALRQAATDVVNTHGSSGHVAAMYRLKAALAAAPSSPNPVADNPAGDPVVNVPRVRELEFKPRNRAPNDLVARSTVGQYDVGIVRGGFTAIRRDGDGDHVLIKGATEASAIAACNADASSRVLASLEPACLSPTAQSETQPGLSIIDGWRDVASAPKDGSEILLTDGQTVGSGFWSDAADAKRADAGWFWESDRDNLLIAKNAHGVTHWHPLPPPPAAEGSR